MEEEEEEEEEEEDTFLYVRFDFVLNSIQFFKYDFIIKHLGWI